MVMHARKYQRLNDGYHERGQGHSYEDKNPSKSRSSSKYTDSKESPGYRHREESPTRPSPRYSSKSSYLEREKERSGRVSSSPSDKRSNHASSSHSSRSSSKNGKGRDYREKDHKSEIQKSAITVSGDWSEHKSSSGKKYYYNCKTELSQWEKPREWIDQQSSKGDGGRKDVREKPASKGHDDRHKHSTGGDKYSQSRHNERPSSYSSEKHSRQSSSSQQKLSHQKSWPSHDSHGTPAHKDTRSNSTSTKHELLQRKDHTPDHRMDYRDDNRYGSQSRDTPKNTTNSRPSGNNMPNISASSDSQTPQRRVVQVLHRSSTHDDSRQRGDDMEISPGSTPTEESMSEKLLLTNVSSSSTTVPSTSTANSVLGAVAALPNLLTQLGDNTIQRINSQQLTHQGNSTSIQTLQKLQEALIAQQRQQQQQLAQLLQQQLSSHHQSAGHPQPSDDHNRSHDQHPQQNGSQSPESEGTPLQSPELNMPESSADRSHYLGQDEKSPRSEQSKSSRRPSPTPSQNSALGAMSAAHKKPDTIQLPASLANYYDERLITHVSSWIEEGRSLERAADHYGEEAHNIGCLGSTQISADLKRARSWVRVTEIQSTLQEQRILLIRQQIKDLENLRSQNTFMGGNT